MKENESNKGTFQKRAKKAAAVAFAARNSYIKHKKPYH